MVVQGTSAAIAGSVSPLITMPLNTINTRLQVLDGEDSNSSSNNRKRRNLVREGG